MDKLFKRDLNGSDPIYCKMVEQGVYAHDWGGGMESSLAYED